MRSISLHWQKYLFSILNPAYLERTYFKVSPICGIGFCPDTIEFIVHTNTFIASPAYLSAQPTPSCPPPDTRLDGSKIMEITPLRRCVCVIGPQSTGKTILVNALADRFGGNVPVIREVARTVMEEKGYTRQDVDSANEERKFALQRDIFIAQIKMENEGLKSDSPFLSDRSAIDPLVYLTHYGGSDSAQPLLSTEEWKRARDRYSTKCLIILLSPVLPFLVDDDIRYVSKSLDDWYSLADSFREFVRLHNIPVMELGEECIELQERVSAVLIKLVAAEEVVEGKDGKVLCGFGG